MSKNNSRVSSVSYEAIKAEAAELEIEPGVYLNATGTAEKAPFLLRVIPNEHVDLDRFCQAVARLTGHTFEETRRENDIRMETVAAAAAEGYTYIDTGCVVYELRIAGSVDSTTAAPTRQANPVYLGAYPSRELAASLAAIGAKLSKAAAPFAIATVWGKDSHDRFVTGNGTFQVNGTGFSGPSVALVFPSGTRLPAEVESWKPTYIRATAPQGEDAKAVTLEVTCTMGDGGTVTLPKDNVPFKFVAPPVPAPIVEFVNGNPPGSVVTSENVTLGGAYLTGATVTLKYADDEGAPVAKVLEPMSATDEEIVLADNWYEGLPSSKPNIVFEVKTAGGKATIAADFEA